MTFYGDAGEVKFLHSPVCICIEQSNEASCIVMNTLRPNVVPFISIDIRNIPVVASSYVGQWCIKIPLYQYIQKLKAILKCMTDERAEIIVDNTQILIINLGTHNVEQYVDRGYTN